MFIATELNGIYIYICILKYVRIIQVCDLNETQTVKKNKLKIII